MSRFAGKPVFARGRLKDGEMNQTEARFAKYLEGLKHAGEIDAWWFERIKWKVATNCFYTPDFLVRYPDMSFELIEVKGSPKIFQDDAKVKVKATADACPFPIRVAYPVPQKLGGGWRFQEF